MNATENEAIKEQMSKLAEEEYYQKLKQQGITAEFKKTEMSKIAKNETQGVFDAVNMDTRSRRLTRNGGDTVSAAPPKSSASAAPPKSSASAKPPASNASAKPPVSHASQKSAVIPQN